MKKIITILFIFCVISSFDSYCQERNDEARKQLSISLDGQSEKLSNVTGWSKLENKDGKFWEQSSSSESRSYLPCCKFEEFTYMQTFKFSLEGGTYYLLVIKINDRDWKSYAFNSSSLKKMDEIINAADGKGNLSPKVEYCDAPNNFDPDQAIKDKNMIRSLLIEKPNYIIFCRSVFILNSQVLKGDSIVRFRIASVETFDLSSNYFEIKKADFRKLFSFRPYLSLQGTYDSAWKKLKTGDFEGAIRDFEICISIDPKQSLFFNGRGMAKQSMTQYDASISDFSTAIGLNGGPYPYRNRGYSKLGLNDLNGAKEDFKKSLELAKGGDDLISLCNYISDTYSSIGMYLEAICYKSKAIEMSSIVGKPPAQFFTDRADAYIRIKDTTELERKLANKSTELGLDLIEEFTFVGLPGAIKDCDNAILLDANMALAFYIRGVAKIKSDQQKSACDDFKKAKELGYSKADAVIESFCK